jgi:hypothetical protein
LDETRQRADPEGRLLPPRDDAEAGYAKDLVSFGRGNGDPPNRAPDRSGRISKRGSPSARWLRGKRAFAGDRFRIGEAPELAIASAT